MYSLNCRGKLIELTSPVVMGILNLTPDSFYASSRVDPEHVVQRAGDMLHAGATFLDVGGQSTRPGSQQVSAGEEMQRVIPAIEAIHKAFPGALISVDTFYAAVAREAVHAGASLVNDVSAGQMDDAMIGTVAALQVPYVLMHMLGKPSGMQHNPVYNNVVLDVFDFLSFRIAALTRAGIKDIIIDPGFGFGKTIEHNFKLLQHLEYFRKLNKPLLIGLSRKATVYKTLGITPEQALNGTTVMNTLALVKGASILRVHDVKEAIEAIRLCEALKK